MLYTRFTAALLLITLVMLVVSCTDGKEINEAFREGMETGKKMGFDEGYQAGADTGYHKGFSDGKTIAQEEAYHEGFENGHEQGLKKGYENGVIDGYTNGVINGLEQGHHEGKTEAFTLEERRELLFRKGTIIVLWMVVFLGCYWFFYRTFSRS